MSEVKRRTNFASCQLLAVYTAFLISNSERIAIYYGLRALLFSYILNLFVEPLGDILPVVGEIGCADGAAMLLRGFDVFDKTFENFADSLRARMLLSL